MTTGEARELFGYESWATALMFSAAEALTQEQREALAASSFPSISATLAHIVAVEWIWLRRWLGDSPKSMPAWADKPTLAELKVQLAAVEAERTSFLAPLTDADLEVAVSYRAPDGLAFSHPLGQLIRHVVNHSTYHRGQLATLLRQLGHTPPNTDFTRYLREGKNGPSDPQPRAVGTE
ncbi:MAG TPA: DinB family protein [Thermoanaerobaculia bacterium]|nr:DinB family protein [Thermoanaerobaculia bacterium]